MLNIAKHQIAQILIDARFIVLLIIVIMLFSANAFVYSDLYSARIDDWNDLVNANNSLVNERTGNLQALANTVQLMLNKPSPLMFIAEASENRIPNAIRVNAFSLSDIHSVSRANKKLWLLPSLDWSFIVGGLLSIVALFFSFDAINGEKRDGTLKYVLSYRLSRLSFFMGKFTGIIVVLSATYLVGVLINIALIVLLGKIPAAVFGIETLGWPVLLSLLLLAWMTALGMLASSLTHRPSVALVILLVFWIAMAEVVPGAARMIANQIYDIPSGKEAAEQLSRKLREVGENQSNNAFSVPQFPDADPEVVEARKKWFEDMAAAQNEFIRERTQDEIGQFKTVAAVSSLSPLALFSESLGLLSGTGIYGFERFKNRADGYRSRLHQFVVDVDAVDPDSPHVIYSAGSYSDRGAFSTKDVDSSTVPRYTELWPSGEDFGAEIEPPYLQIGVFLGLLVLTFAAAFAAFARYDLR